MKSLLHIFIGCRAIRARLTISFTAFWLGSVSPIASSPAPFSATAYLNSVPVPGIVITNDLGQVYLKGNVHVVRVQADDARVTGRLQAMPDVVLQAAGTRIFSGIAYVEVGAWDAAGINFTRAGGVWDLAYRGVTQADGSVQYQMAGSGIGGAIDRLRMELTATRAAGATFDPALPYLATGTIHLGPISTVEVLSTFDQPVPSSWNRGAGTGALTLIPASGQLTIRGQWSFPTHTAADSTAWVSPLRPWAVQAGQSLEARVDLVSLNAAARGVVLGAAHKTGVGYFLLKGRDSIVLGKHGNGMTILLADKVTTPNANVIVVLGLTPVGENVILTVRLLDKDNAEATLYERSVLDTPASDLSLNAAELATLTGLDLTDILNDPAGAPWTSGNSPWIGVFQYTDGSLPAAEATFDNFELRRHETPQFAIQNAVLLSWPAMPGRFAVESAPTVSGPWTAEANALERITNGLCQATILAQARAKYFRLRLAP